jgi:hypothetical protein
VRGVRAAFAVAEDVEGQVKTSRNFTDQHVYLGYGIRMGSQQSGFKCKKTWYHIQRSGDGIR